MSGKYSSNVVWPFVHKLPSNFMVENKKILTTSGTNEIGVINYFKSFQTFSASQIQLYKELKDDYANLGWDVRTVLRMDISDMLDKWGPNYQLGDQMQKIQELKKFLLQEDGSYNIQEESELEFQNDIVYLVNFWGYYSSSYDEFLQTNVKLLEKNDQWIGKVKVISICHGGCCETLKQDIQVKKWELLEHYVLDISINSVLLKNLEINQGVNFIVLINKWGKIIYIGDPQQINLEESINELIASEKDDIQLQQQEKQEINDSKPEETISYEEYKELKSVMKNLQIEINNAVFEGQVELNMTKIKHWKPDGQKIFKSSSKLELIYNVDVKEESKLNQFINNHWKQIPDNLKIIKESIIRDPAKAYAKIQETFSALGTQLIYKDIKKTRLRLNQLNNQFEVTDTQEQKLFAKDLNHALFSKALNILEVHPNKQEFDEFLNELRENQLSFKVGQPFIPIRDYKKWGDEESTTIEHKSGQVLIILFWLNQNYCQEEIEKIIALQQKNQENWVNQIKIVALNLNQDIQQQMQNFEQYANSIDFYFPMPDGYKLDLERQNIFWGSVPQFVFVNKFGIITNPGDSQFEQIIQNLIQEQIPQKVDFPEETANNLLNYVKRVETVEKFINIDKTYFLEIEIQLEQHKIGEQIQFQQPILNISCRDFELEEVQQTLSSLFEFIPENNWIINKNIEKTYSVTYPGNVCAVCQKDILKEAQQYYSPFKKEHVCAECAEFDDSEKNGYERFKYQDTLKFINGPLTDLSVLSHIDNQKVGKNLKVETTFSQFHYVECKGCNAINIEGIRYIAANATLKIVYKSNINNQDRLDYCQKCFVQLKNKKSEQSQEIIKKAEKDGMTEDNLFVRVLFSNGYQSSCF